MSAAIDVQILYNTTPQTKIMQPQVVYMILADTVRGISMSAVNMSIKGTTATGGRNFYGRTSLSFIG